MSQGLQEEPYFRRCYFWQQQEVVVWGKGGVSEILLRYDTLSFRLGSISQNHFTTFPQRAGDLQLLPASLPGIIRICEKVIFFSAEQPPLHFLLLFLGTPDTKKMSLQKHPTATMTCKETPNSA